MPSISRRRVSASICESGFARKNLCLGGVEFCPSVFLSPQSLSHSIQLEEQYMNTSVAIANFASMHPLVGIFIQACCMYYQYPHLVLAN